jgi:hypothetical protein
MFPIYVRLTSDDGSQVEAIARTADGGLLPPGRWRVRRPDGSESVMDVDDMPPSWRRQLHATGEFGKRLD